MASYFGFSDGGCINNGKKNAKAAYCGIATDGNEKYIMRGLVEPYKYFLDIEQIQFSDTDTNIDTHTDTITAINLENLLSVDNTMPIPPSNNRGELLGLIYCFAQLLNIGLKDDVSKKLIEIYSDSLICIKTFNIWLPNRKKNGTENELKNLDLIIIADYLYSCIKKMYKSVKLIHVKSHQTRPHESKGTKSLFIWLGNNFVDKQCSEILSKKN